MHRGHQAEVVNLGDDFQGRLVLEAITADPLPVKPRPLSEDRPVYNPNFDPTFSDLWPLHPCRFPWVHNDERNSQVEVITRKLQLNDCFSWTWSDLLIWTFWLSEVRESTNKNQCSFYFFLKIKSKKKNIQTGRKKRILFWVFQAWCVF